MSQPSSLSACLTSFNTFFSLDNVKSDLSSYVQNINFVNDNNGLLLALPDKSRIPASWNVSLVSDDQFNRATVANLMLIGAGRTFSPEFQSELPQLKVLMFNDLCLL